MASRERWHDRTISEIESRLQFLRNIVDIKTSKGSKYGPDIQLIMKKEKRKVNVEVQQFDSGKPWKSQTIPRWKERHEFLTFVIFPEPVLERVLSKIDEIEEYVFFKQKDVFLFSDNQLSDIVSFVGSLLCNRKLIGKDFT